MHQTQLIKSITLRNLLSFGDSAGEIKLGRLNVLIGPNGSGKSNLIEAISLLQATPSSIAGAIRKGGGIMEWLWKGRKDESCPAELEAIIGTEDNNNMSLRYRISFFNDGQHFEIDDELLEDESPHLGDEIPYFYYKYRQNHPILNVNEQQRSLQRESVDPKLSILSQRKDPDGYPELTWLGEQFGKIKIYREWIFGRRAELRKPQAADAPNEFLQEDCLNLGLVLNALRRKPIAKKAILRYLNEFYEGIDDFDVSVEGGTVQFFLQEGDFTIPATRLSDGTIRFICLLSLLCHPSPPPLICIEEPELGLHPDIIPTLAKLLVEASEKTQLVVTTHSDILVDALTSTPDSILVCEKEDGATRICALEPEMLKDWLEKYTLGQLWRKGEIGGNRW